MAVQNHESRAIWRKKHNARTRVMEMGPPAGADSGAVPGAV